MKKGRGKARAAAELLDLACALAKYQASGGRFYIMEHPRSASSWRRPKVQELPGGTVTLDQCMLGLKTKVTKQALRQPTTLKSNSEIVLSAFMHVRCDGSHAHGTVQGSEGGEKVSTWSQRYPPQLCQALVESIVEQCKIHKHMG